MYIDNTNGVTPEQLVQLVTKSNFLQLVDWGSDGVEVRFEGVVFDITFKGRMLNVKVYTNIFVTDKMPSENMVVAMIAGTLLTIGIKAGFKTLEKMMGLTFAILTTLLICAGAIFSYIVLMPMYHAGKTQRLAQKISDLLMNTASSH
jgi:hypothetical protein